MLGEWPHSAPVESEAAKKAEDPPPIEPPVPLPPLAEAEPLPVPLPEPEPEPVPAAVAPAVAADEATEDSAQPPDVEGAELAPALHDVALARSQQATARYSLDPLAEPAVKRRFGRGETAEPPPVVEVPARPNGVRPLPGRPTRQD